MAIPRIDIFEPEYFSGLNYRDAEKLIDKKVGFTDNPYDGWRVGTLSGLRDEKYHFLSGSDRTHFEYIRTCLETYAHPTITIGGVELPRPETEAPEKGRTVWRFNYTAIRVFTWQEVVIEQDWLINGRLHLTEERAQAWADWWENTVIKELK